MPFSSLRRTLATFAAPLAVTAAAFAFFAPQAASATTPFSVEFGEQFSTQRPLSISEPYLGLNYDLGPKTIVPLRASIQADLSAGGLNFGGAGFGLAVRTTTPLYVGAGASLYSLGGGTYLGTNFFVGSQLFTVPGGTTVGIQGTYKVIPAEASSVGVGLRIQI